MAKAEAGQAGSTPSPHPHPGAQAGLVAIASPSHKDKAPRDTYWPAVCAGARPR